MPTVKNLELRVALDCQVVLVRKQRHCIIDAALFDAGPNCFLLIDGHRRDRQRQRMHLELAFVDELLAVLPGPYLDCEWACVASHDTTLSPEACLGIRVFVGSAKHVGITVGLPGGGTANGDRAFLATGTELDLIVPTVLTQPDQSVIVAIDESGRPQRLDSTVDPDLLTGLEVLPVKAVFGSGDVAVVGRCRADLGGHDT